MKTSIPRVNNFDIIRLLAALQVVYRHTLEHFELKGAIEKIGEYFLFYFPGVPIFFTISGFLIFWSFDRNSTQLKKYFRNRFLRLFPGLWVCLLLTILLLLYDYPGDKRELLSNTSFLAWIGAQFTVFQFWTPDILRFWGVGTPNGSLWTIMVEVQFYIIVPLIYFLSKKTGKRIYVIMFFFLLSLLCNVFIAFSDPENVKIKLLGVSVLPFLYNFLLGTLAYIYWDKIKKLVIGKFFWWFAIYVTYITIFGTILQIDLNEYTINNPLQLISNIILAFLVLSAGFTKMTLSNRLLDHQDISYGVYIYHMLVINFLVQRHYVGSVTYLMITFAATILIAFVSWKLIEEKALKLK